MFCDRCGSQVEATSRFCQTCGKSFQAAVPSAPPARASYGQGRVAGNFRTLGLLWILYSALRLMSGWFLTAFFPRMFDGWPFFHNNLLFPVGGLFRFVGLFTIGTAVLGIIAGWGLLERQPWARALAIVLGVLTLIRIPVGTALGIYTLWVLIPGESEIEYRQLSGTRA